jgi:hypothetical protein
MLQDVPEPEFTVRGGQVGREISSSVAKSGVGGGEEGVFPPRGSVKCFSKAYIACQKRLSTHYFPTHRQVDLGGQPKPKVLPLT